MCSSDLVERAPRARTAPAGLLRGALRRRAPDLGALQAAGDPELGDPRILHPNNVPTALVVLRRAPLRSAPLASREPVLPSTLDETVGKAEKPHRAVAAPFSWKDDFGRPDTVIDALGAQHALEVVSVAPSVAEEEANEKKPLLGSKEMAVSMAIGLVLGVVLFIVAPAFVTNLIETD